MQKILFLIVAILCIGKVHSQKVGIGTSTPDSLLTVNGSAHILGTTKTTNFQLNNGAGNGKILQSDASGNASWVTSVTGSNMPSIQICGQVWTTINLEVTTYRDGTPIPKVTDGTAWSSLTTGAYCYYNNDSATYAAIYGKLYNWYAVTDPRGLAPLGWHIPTDAEWTILTTCLGGEPVAAGRMKVPGTAIWTTPNTAASNSSGFASLPGGYRNEFGNFYFIGSYSCWWSSTELNTTYAWFRYLDTNLANAIRFNSFKLIGFSARCIRD